MKRFLAAMSPLSASAPVYLVTQNPNGDLRGERAHDVYVTHFATCVDVRNFSHKKEPNP